MCEGERLAVSSFEDLQAGDSIFITSPVDGYHLSNSRDGNVVFREKDYRAIPGTVVGEYTVQQSGVTRYIAEEIVDRQVLVLKPVGQKRLYMLIQDEVDMRSIFVERA